MTRIVGGRWSGRTLTVPAGSHTRPTAEKVRAALGNSLTSGGALAGSTVLDLFAGSGALGLELLSRGAGALVLVENDRAALTALRANVAALGAAEAVVVPSPAAAYPAQTGPRFDIVVADPPYDLPNDDLTAILAGLVAHDRLAPGADVVLERSRRTADLAWPVPLAAAKSKRYGDTVLLFAQLP